MHPLSQTQHELVFKNQPPLPGGLPKENFWEFDTSGFLGIT
jgi:hypothetical protein